MDQRNFEEETMNRKKIDVYDNLTEIVKELKEGVLLTAKADDQVNSMTISWGMLGSNGAGRSS